MQEQSVHEPLAVEVELEWPPASEPAWSYSHEPEQPAASSSVAAERSPSLLSLGLGVLTPFGTLALLAMPVLVQALIH
jgi:hypothetical protein